MGSELGPESPSVSCPCGASIQVDVRAGRPVTVCPECKEPLTIVVTVDPQSGKRRVGILVSPAAVAPRKARRKAPTRVPAAPGAPQCPCGAQVVVDLKSVDSVYTCGWCGACFTAMARPGSEGILLIPVQVEPLRKEKKTTVRRMKPKTEAPGGAAALALHESQLLISRGTIGAQPLVARDRGSIMSCFCGREIAVSPEASRRLLKCPDCGLSFRVFLAEDPKTRKSMVVTVPQAPLPDKR
jgi:transcription elongation factor Elf1